ncbi:MAG: hypothetical protein U9P10_00255 [Thermodesulfobacteriota bacterium]|nr:hypothetical protein [Thermodesulfobacteriota bacterium]
MPELAERVTLLENIVQELAYSQLETNRSINRLSDEMREFKNEMSEYKEWSKEQITTMNRQITTMNTQITTMNKQWGNLANKLGTVVEDIVLPNIPRIAEVYFGCQEMDYIAARVKKRNTKNSSRRKEFDTIAVCNGRFILNETKSSPEIRDADNMAKFVESRELFDYFPEYKGYKIYPVFSSLYRKPARKPLSL